MKEEKEIIYEDRLLKVLSITIDWLKFAESKNAVLITFNAASIYGITRALSLDFFSNIALIKCILIISIALMIVSVSAGLLSFLPQIKFLTQNEVGMSSQSNYLYFGSLKNKSEIQIIQGICETQDKEFSKFEIDIAHQIQQNSIIASEKYALFRVAVWITIFAYFNILTLILLWHMRSSKNKVS